jgi:ribosomal protein S6E (S10)
MERRDFLKNSLFALFSTAIASNKVLATVAETLTPNSPKVLLYLIQKKNGFWFVRGTKWIDIAKTKINEEKYNIETFKPLDIIDNSIANKRRLELWKEYNCGGGIGGGIGFPLNVEKSTNSQKIALNSEGMKNYYKSDLKKINSSIHGKNLAEKGIPQKNGLKVLDLPLERRIEIQKKSAQSRTGRKASEQHKFAISNSLKGKSKSEEHKKSLSLSKIGKKMDEETKRKISMTISGDGNPMFGKTHSKETRKKMSQNHTGYNIERTCLICRKTLKGTNFFKYHGDKCKFKTIP